MMSVGNDLVTSLAAGNTDQLALVSSVRQLSYAVLIEEIRHCSAWLGGLNGRMVALHAENSIDWVIADLACQQAGLPCVPLPAFFSTEQVTQCLLHSGADILLSDKPAWVQQWASAEGKDFKLVARGQYASLSCYQLTDTIAGVMPSETGKITFTSGSTGGPKGVCLSNQHQWQVAQSLASVIGCVQPKHLCLLPLSTLLENLAGVYSPLLCGGTVVIAGDAERGMQGSSGLNQAALLACIDRTEPTTMILIPQLLTVLVAACQMGWRPPASLEFVAVGGGVVSPELLSQADNYGLPVFQGYGLSECASVVALNTPDDNRPGLAGRVLRHCTVSIEDAEVVVHGANHLGYLGVPDSWYPRKVYTGDIGALDKGFLSINGRKKNILITSYGRNVSPEWVESALMSKPLLSQCLVLGDGMPTLGALVCAPPFIDEQAIAAWIQQINLRLPDYARIGPWARLDEALLKPYVTANGRLQRQQIESAFAAEIEQLYASSAAGFFPKTVSGTSMTFYQHLQTETSPHRDYLMSAPIIGACLAGDISLKDYVAFLQQAYHHVKHTTPLLMATGASLPASKEWLRNAVAEYIEEELGHQEWILNDIAACGFDSEKARGSTPNLSTELMVSYAYDTINRINPLGFFGMVNVLEGTSIKIADVAADRIQETLGLPANAFSYLRSHGKLDQQHIEFFKGLMNRIDDPAEQRLIIHAARAFYQLYGNVFRELAPDQALLIAA